MVVAWEVLATYDPESRGGDPADGRKVKGATIHWVDAATAVDAEVRLDDNLFLDEAPDATDKNFLECRSGFSEILTGCKVEGRTGRRRCSRQLSVYASGIFLSGQQRLQIRRHLVFNRSVSLKTASKNKPQNRLLRPPDGRRSRFCACKQEVPERKPSGAFASCY